MKLKRRCDERRKGVEENRQRVIEHLRHESSAGTTVEGDKQRGQQGDRGKEWEGRINESKGCMKIP